MLMDISSVDFEILLNKLKEIDNIDDICISKLSREAVEDFTSMHGVSIVDTIVDLCIDEAIMKNLPPPMRHQEVSAIRQVLYELKPEEYFNFISMVIEQVSRKCK